jgi:7-cyano-7-deazaguanine synthase
MNKAVIIYSGGLDSTVLLTKCKKEFDEIVALNFNYGSKHNDKERGAARKVCKILDVKLVEVNLPFINELFKSNLLQSGGTIPEGHYEDPIMRRTVVPYRNSIMLSIAAGFAESIGAKYVAIANHAGDHEIYPDCQKEYIKAFAAGIRLGGYGEIIIHSPFVDWGKNDIVRYGVEIGAPLELSWSCYKGGEKHCGLCGTDVERIEAFKLNKIIDPVEYEIEVDWAGCKKYNNAKS